MAYPPHSPTGNAFAIRFSKMAKPVAKAPHSPECRYTMPFRFSEMAYPPHSPLANAFAIRFSEMAKPVANAPHSPEWRYAKCHSNECRCTERRYAKCRSTICHFVSVKWQSLWRMHRIRQSVVIQSVVLPNIVVPSGVMLNVIVSFAILLQRNAFACGECGVFANSLKRIGKWQSHCPPNALV